MAAFMSSVIWSLSDIRMAPGKWWWRCWVIRS